ncbi:GNAT family N-acetyltransferase [Roseibium salinum]|uniref:GNAT family N-acetyltransferase n=1 Tax=Roseibium salinum TaxID=1604349 RepID=A0ABT3R7A7_9HYPH|nr:GNAT family N-acetyltransferase [Roseibium sp. DSM 29163]MCX2724940.1 GNAT family N-acetyltransferase [Roseibium sp. DSM 29163]MDN3721130.1 GNAT family N-acetyltransferase [Roseibium salinum]
MTVVPLACLPEAADQIERWYLEEWQDWYGPDGPGNARQDLADYLTVPDALPVCLVALDRQATPVGTVSLRDTSPGSDRYPGAWLTALLVPSGFRRSGTGTRLVEGAEQQAARLGFSELFSTTGSAQSLLLRRNWHRLDTVRTPDGILEIFRKALDR